MIKFFFIFYNFHSHLPNLIPLYFLLLMPTIGLYLRIFISTNKTYCIFRYTCRIFQTNICNTKSIGRLIPHHVKCCRIWKDSGDVWIFTLYTTSPCLLQNTVSLLLYITNLYFLLPFDINILNSILFVIFTNLKALFSNKLPCSAI